MKRRKKEWGGRDLPEGAVVLEAQGLVLGVPLPPLQLAPLVQLQPRHQHKL